MKAFANYYGRHFSKLYKTQYVFIGNTLSPVLFSLVGLHVPTFEIPPFAKSVTVVPSPNASMTIRLLDIMAIGSDSPSPPVFVESYVIPSGSYPTIPIIGNVNTIQILSTGAGDVVAGLKLIYEIGF